MAPTGAPAPRLSAAAESAHVSPDRCAPQDGETAAWPPVSAADPVETRESPVPRRPAAATGSCTAAPPSPEPRPQQAHLAPQARALRSRPPDALTDAPHRIVPGPCPDDQPTGESLSSAHAR